MKDRCEKPNCHNYDNYGGRGISICDEWKDSFENFYKWAMDNGYTDDREIDRMDVNGDYCPENCRWVTDELQANNTRRNKYVTYKGYTFTLSEWSRILNLGSWIVGKRLKAGWNIEDAILTPSGELTGKYRVLVQIPIEYAKISEERRRIHNISIMDGLS